MVGYVDSKDTADERVVRIALLLFCSGACALVYQVAWFRELRLVFGASTAASSAVMAVFMGGLGLGGAHFGKRADSQRKPLALYAHLEIAAAVLAATTPLLVRGANAVYLAAGGTAVLGSVGSTVLRLVLSAIVLGPATFLMGGTLPAAARAAGAGGNSDRSHVATLYAANTAGAVLGTVLANFLLLEVLGTRLTVWGAALVNVLVGVIARSIARDQNVDETATDGDVGLETVPSVTPWVPPLAAALAGASFMLMELTWYRMLAPILGGSSYTFGLILTVALAGIGIGGALYARTRRQSTLRRFAATCAAEAFLIALPFALGDRVALGTALLRPFCRLGFLSSVGVWTAVAALVVLPAAVVSGMQFPLIIGLYGRGPKAVGRHVGAAYLANTLGAIGGALAGGFGLIPLLGAVGCWRLVAISLALAALVALGLDHRRRSSSSFALLRRSLPSLAVSAAAVLLVATPGPSAVWRHSGIGAGRADKRLEPVDRRSLEAFVATAHRAIEWEVDGIESSVALGRSTGYSFIVNGKADGHALVDAGTQVMSGLLAALLHPELKSALVVGLGTGSTAGWLGSVPSVERVDVVELEPAILRVARDCAPVSQAVLDNRKVHIQLADAREVLRTTPRRYDVIFSEPSNPYRAGTSSLYTVEFYRAASQRLESGGYFVQWIQSYEVDAWAVATALVTLRQVFEDVSLWEASDGDFLLLARQGHEPFSVGRVRARLQEEPMATAVRRVWRTDSVEGVFSHFLAQGRLTDILLANGLGAVNTDDQNLLEFAFARSVGRPRDAAPTVYALARRLGVDTPEVTEPLVHERMIEERWLFQEAEGATTWPPFASRPNVGLGRVIELHRAREHAAALAAWKVLGREPRSLGEATMIAECAARVGAPTDAARIDAAPPVEREILRAIAAVRGNDRAASADALTSAFTAARTDPWVRERLLRDALNLAVDVGTVDPRQAGRLMAALHTPFAVEALREERLLAALRLAAAMHDIDACVAALAPLEPPPLDDFVLQTRAACYTKSRHPLAEQAQLALLAAQSVSFGASLQAPAAPATERKHP